MVFTFDFHDFDEKIAGGKHFVQDAWGQMVDVRGVELIISTSMLKLWDCYNSIDEYLEECRENGYTFGITKVCPKELENERSLNYQFIQSYRLSDEQIDKLIMPTLNEIRDVLGGDYRKALLFLRGKHLNDRNVETVNEYNYFNAMMVDPRVYDDPFVRHKIYEMIAKRITEAKIGVISVHGNYSIVGGDPYAFCQHIFGLPVTGLLKAGYLYNRYWVDCGAERVVGFRAPMSCANNIRLMRVARSEEIDYWFKYIKTGTLINSWDTLMCALNGMDFDGDLMMLSDNEVLIDNYRPTRTIMCVQRSAQKTIPTEDDLIASNIAGFGDDIGRTTNFVTSMYDVMAGYTEDSIEYQTLEYRIQSGQLYQQNCIDKIKGISCNPMPRSWYDPHVRPKGCADEIVELYASIAADKKPYFMRYIYPALMSDYNTFIKKTTLKCLMEFGLTVEELLAVSDDQKTEEQKQFIKYYYDRLPVSVGDCVMNRICRRVEMFFEKQIRPKMSNDSFDYSFMKSGREYTDTQYYAILKLYNEHKEALQDYRRDAASRRSADKTENEARRNSLARLFRSRCYTVCSEESVLCDIILDVCYKHEGTKQFAWDICGRAIFKNLFANSGGMIEYPTRDENGDIEYAGEKFSMVRKESEQWLKSL